MGQLSSTGRPGPLRSLTDPDFGLRLAIDLLRSTSQALHGARESTGLASGTRAMIANFTTANGQEPKRKLF